MMPLTRVVITASTLVLATFTVQAVVPYRIIDLGDLPGGGDFSQAFGINETGQVAGFSSAATGSRAFLWTRAGGMKNLGDLPGGADFSQAFGINNAGQVAGSSGATGGTRAFLWTPGAGMQNLGVLPGDVSSSAFAINNTGHIVGSSRDADNGPRAFRWTAGGGMQELRGGDPFSTANGINDAGQAVGETLVGAFEPTLWTASGSPQGLQTPASGFANGINNAGQVVGAISSSTVGLTRAALWTAGDLQDLGVLARGEDFLAQASAHDINAAGQVVGSSAVSGGDHAFLWTADGGMQDLNALIDPLDPLRAVTTLFNATGINNAGQIVGSGFINGKERAYLITPVPEPETYAVMVSGLGLLGFMLRRRRAAARLHVA